MTSIGADQLREVLDYDATTGAFRWRQKIARKVVVGTQAGSVAQGYVQIKLFKRRYLAHRLAFLHVTGSVPPLVDHINRVTTDNRWCNLRAASVTQNNGNRAVFGGSSKFKGVSWARERSLWLACIRVDGRPKNLGRFVSEEAAARAYDAAARSVFGPYARLNFPLAHELGVSQ